MRANYLIIFFFEINCCYVFHWLYRCTKDDKSKDRTSLYFIFENLLKRIKYSFLVLLAKVISNQVSFEPHEINIRKGTTSIPHVN